MADTHRPTHTPTHTGLGGVLAVLAGNQTRLVNLTSFQVLGSLPENSFDRDVPPRRVIHLQVMGGASHAMHAPTRFTSLHASDIFQALISTSSPLFFCCFTRMRHVKSGNEICGDDRVCLVGFSVSLSLSSGSTRRQLTSPGGLRGLQAVRRRESLLPVEQHQRSSG